MAGSMLNNAHTMPAAAAICNKAVIRYCVFEMMKFYRKQKPCLPEFCLCRTAACDERVLNRVALSHEVRSEKPQGLLRTI